MMVCHYGSFDSGYARSVVFRKALEERGHRVVDCSSRDPNHLKRQAHCARRAIELGSAIDVLVVGTVGHYSMPAAFALAKALNRPLVFDIFDSIWETCVYDTWQLKEGSLRAEYYRHLDRSMASLAELAVVDTEQHRQFFVDKIGVAADKMRQVPVGVDTGFFDRSVVPSGYAEGGDEIVVGFVGSFFKSHGIDCILAAAKQLLSRAANLRFDFYGDGPVHGDMQRLAKERGLENVHFHGRVPYHDVPAIVAGFDVVLGLFGKTGKVLHVVPNKAYEAAAMAKPFVTGDTPAMQAAFADGEETILVPLADPDALADQLANLAQSASLRQSLGERIAERFDADFSLDTIGERWEALLLEASDRHGRRSR